MVLSWNCRPGVSNWAAAGAAVRTVAPNTRNTRRSVRIMMCSLGLVARGTVGAERAPVHVDMTGGAGGGHRVVGHRFAAGPRRRQGFVAGGTRRRRMPPREELPQSACVPVHVAGQRERIGRVARLARRSQLAAVRILMACRARRADARQPPGRAAPGRERPGFHQVARAHASGACRPVSGNFVAAWENPTTANFGASIA